jgi:hypothetical protein
MDANGSAQDRRQISRIEVDTIPPPQLAEQMAIRGHPTCGRGSDGDGSCATHHPEWGGTFEG